VHWYLAIYQQRRRFPARPVRRVGYFLALQQKSDKEKFLVDFADKRRRKVSRRLFYWSIIWRIISLYWEELF
jgi:hypothetical protein